MTYDELVKEAGELNELAKINACKTNLTTLIVRLAEKYKHDRELKTDYKSFFFTDALFGSKSTFMINNSLQSGQNIIMLNSEDMQKAIDKLTELGFNPTPKPDPLPEG